MTLSMSRETVPLRLPSPRTRTAFPYALGRSGTRCRTLTGAEHQTKRRRSPNGSFQKPFHLRNISFVK
ncbi:hypothetical protein XFF6960_120006 [Xanthomonas citri pv. fuscans]|nr:hypothetical protein XFF6960_120006 [Xanthomonas citri pv. fuscans]